MCPGGSGEPTGALAELITRDFGSFDAMKTKLSASTVAVQGSGWGWLGFNKDSGKLQIAACANQVRSHTSYPDPGAEFLLNISPIQDPLQATTGLVPLFGIDVWEHAYYLQYKNVRPDYVKAIFEVIQTAGSSLLERK